MEKFKKEKKKEIEELKTYIKSLDYDKDSLIMILHKATEIFGYLPKEVQIIIADELDMPTSKVFGVVTFYSYFDMDKKGKYNISVCTGTACFVKGAEEVKKRLIERLGINVGEVTPDGKISIVEARCVGACGLAPVVTVNDEVYGKVTLKKIDEIIDKYLNE